MLGPNTYVYPPRPIDEDDTLGVFPVDFLLETILEAGFVWFKTNPDAPGIVFGHLNSKWLKARYGKAKIQEISDFIKKYEIRIVQHFSLISQEYPTISLQLMDGNEMTDRAGLEDYQGQVDQLDFENVVKGRESIGYSPILDNIQIGIHATVTPDLVKYLYYLVVYILNAFKPQLEERGLQLGTFRATDMSRLNDYLPSNMYSRFINFSVFTIATFDKGSVPIIEKIVGVSVIPSEGVATVETQVDPNGA